MEPNYIARKSAFSVLTFVRVISCVLIIPFFVLLYRIAAAKNYRIEFYDDRIVTYNGLINIRKKQVVFMGVTGVSTSKSLMGRIFSYGDVSVDCVGKWDVDTYGIKYPDALESYLQSKIVQAPQSNQFVHM